MSNLVDVCERLHTFYTYGTRHLFGLFFLAFWVFFWRLLFVVNWSLSSEEWETEFYEGQYEQISMLCLDSSQSPAALHPDTSPWPSIHPHPLPSILIPRNHPPSIYPRFLTRLRPYQIFLSDSSLEVLTITCSSIYSDFAYVWFFLCQIFKVVGLHVGCYRLI